MIEAGLATIERRQESLKDTIASLLPQVKRLHVTLNDYEPPAWLRDLDRVIIYCGPNWGDAGKLQGYCGDYFAICDDDLIYPPNYIETLLAGAERHPGAAVSFHGAVMPPNWTGYFAHRLGIACLGDCPVDVKADVIGTGVALLPPSIDCGDIRGLMNALPRNMADIHFACFAAKKRMPLWVLAHPADWIKHSTKVDLNDTIWATAVKDDRVHSRLLKAALG